MNCELTFRGNEFGYQGNGDDHGVNKDDEYGFDEPEYRHPGHEYREEVECEGASKHGNHPNGVRELRGSEWTTNEEKATMGYVTYPDPTSNISICPPTPNNELNGSDYLTDYPSPTSPFVYDNIDKLHRDYEDNIPEAIEYMRAMNQLSDECMADDEDYQSYCREMEERRYHTPSLSPPLVEQEAPPTT